MGVYVVFGGGCMWKLSGMGGRIVVRVGMLRGDLMSKKLNHLIEDLIMYGVVVIMELSIGNVRLYVS